jgi:hypothetical protein
MGDYGLIPFNLKPESLSFKSVSLHNEREFPREQVFPERKQGSSWLISSSKWSSMKYSAAAVNSNPYFLGLQSLLNRTIAIHDLRGGILVDFPLDMRSRNNFPVSQFVCP